MLLVASSAALSSGCLVAEAPDYGGPQRTAPVIQTSSINPTPYELLEVHEGEPDRVFSFQVYSEDVNERLRIAFYQNYQLSDFRWLDDQSRPPSTLDKPHSVTYPLALNKLSDGCRQLTMLVVHESTWDDVHDVPIPERALTDMSSVTWWVNVRPDPDDLSPTTLYNCPTAGQTSEMTQ